jgi:dTDP-L-rhamnose 4-epimerase
VSARRILVTGGAGFIGSHLCRALVQAGHAVRVLDVFDPQVHGGSRRGETPDGAELVRGDLLDASLLDSALDGIETVFHQAASVGVGQSMYRAEAYTRVNAVGTALLMEKIAARKGQVRKVVVASSMSIYGEGAYRCPSCGPREVLLRDRGRMAARRWEPGCPACGADLEPEPTPERKPPVPASVYAVTKRTQEETVLVMGRAYGIPAVALRYFNVYGPGQALSNPYTGVAAIFSSRIRAGNRPILYEDGLQSRDFVHVSDVVRANLLAMEKPEADGEVFNVGTGRPTPLIELARGLIRRLAPGRGLEPEVPGSFREGDVRHCFADIGRIRSRLGFEPGVDLELGMDDLAGWAKDQTVEDRFAAASEELVARGLLGVR